MVRYLYTDILPQLNIYMYIYFLNVQISDIKYIHIALQQICYSYPENWNSVSIRHSKTSFPTTPSNHYSAFCLINLPILGTSFKCNHTTFVLLHLAYFT